MRCVLLIDHGLDACPGQLCSKLPKLIDSFPAADKLNLYTCSHHSPDIDTLPVHLILCRFKRAEEVPETVRSLQARWHNTPVLGLFCSSWHTPDTVSQAVCNGLDDFLCCPFRDVDVFPRFQRFLSGDRCVSPHQSETINTLLQHANLVGTSRPFLHMIEQAAKVAQVDATILLTGETGTGKGLVARAIHYSSPRQYKPFVTINCGALPDHLFENELFGHEPGAYTDASSPKQGLVAEAEGGTLFLDEVDTLSASAQVKLLHFLQEREYRSLGSTKNKTADVRVIAATNANLQQLVQTRQFREDLYYRLHIISIDLPPLRERAEDIPRLADHFLQHYERRYHREALQLSETALHHLISYDWPGNIRELETVIQRAVILVSPPVLHHTDLDLPVTPDRVMSVDESFQKAKVRTIEQFERTYLTHLLTTHNGNVTHAAQQAGKERRTFQRLLRKYDLDRCRYQT